MKELIVQYQKTLERKKRIIKPLIEIKNSIDGFKNNQLKEIQYHVLDAEISLIEKFIDDLIDRV